MDEFIGNPPQPPFVKGGPGGISEICCQFARNFISKRLRLRRDFVEATRRVASKRFSTLDTFEFHLYRIRPVHAFQIDHIRTTPFLWETTPKLEHDDVGKGIMVKESAEAAGIVTAKFNLFPHFMPGITMALYAFDRSYDLITNPWIVGHIHLPPFPSLPFCMLPSMPYFGEGINIPDALAPSMRFSVLWDVNSSRAEGRVNAKS